MSREWKPGDVALLMTERGDRIGFRCGVPGNMGWQYAREAGQNTWSSDGSGYVKPIRPLVVLDPEDREQVERLWKAWRDNVLNYTLTQDNLQQALREFADPKPPKPEEPTGLGAVVEDAEGRRWVRTCSDPYPWGYSSRDEEGDRYTDACTYDDIDAVRVLSEGVQP